MEYMTASHLSMDCEVYCTFTVESYYFSEVRVAQVTISFPKVGSSKGASHLSASLIESVL